MSVARESIEINLKLPSSSIFHFSFILKESESWLHALPISSLGSRLDNEAIIVTETLELGIYSLICVETVGYVDCFIRHRLFYGKSQENI